MAEGAGEAPVSFTDTNAETGATGKGTGSSNMMDLVGQLKKKETTGESEEGKTKDTSEKKKKKKKKKKKGKSKYKRRHDRYEPENYLLRVEGSICCGMLISLGLFFFYNALVLLVVIIWSKGEIRHLHNKEEIKYDATTTAP